jgi:hypothetical protein
MLQAMAVATAIAPCFVFEVLTEGFIRLILEELALAGIRLGSTESSPRGIRRHDW